jgi:acyl-coenzyme A synthetase/AMP-(fatty) acid ligase
MFFLTTCCRGYVGNPQATQESLTADGYFKTGDVMVVDERGGLTVVDRKKELIKYKGLQGTLGLPFDSAQRRMTVLLLIFIHV